MSPHYQAPPSSSSTHPLGTEIYTTTQIAQTLHLSMRMILWAIKSGKLTARRTGKQVLITRDAMQRYWDGLPLVVSDHTAPNA
jgi:excisionase family DNA binding protein